jgi:hypothetical protein
MPVRLALRGDRIVLSGPDEEALDAGSFGAILAQLRHEPATAAELEAAIETAEDGLMPVVRSLAGGASLVTAMPEIAKAAGSGTLDMAAVQTLFDRLADVASGMPAARLGIPPTREFAAALILLRELMHHGGFASVVVRGSDEA